LSRYVRDGAADAAAVDAPLNNINNTLGRRILEIGPGTGAVTGRIVRYMRPSDRLVLVERNDQFVDFLRRQLAESHTFRAAVGRIELVHGPVEDLPEGQSYDLIISGLPMNNFTAASVEAIFAKLRRLLAPHGKLSFFEYVAVRRVKSIVSRPAERERLRNIGHIFQGLLSSHKVRHELVLANVPPAWVHHVQFEESSRGVQAH
jgi:phospholipid N-methyltransferase